MKPKYSLRQNPLAITELSCTIIAFLLLFVPWITYPKLFSDVVVAPFTQILKTSTPFAIILVGAFLGNIIMKIFKRSTWLSTIVTFLIGNQIWIQYRNQEYIDAYSVKDATEFTSTFNFFGILTIIIEVILIICVLTSLLLTINNWLKRHSRKTAKKLLYIAVISLGVRIFSSWLGDSVFIFALSTIAVIVFFISGLLGALIWFVGQKDTEKSNNDSGVKANSRKRYLIGIGFVLLAILISTLISNIFNNQETESSTLPFKKIVKLSKDNVNLRMKPDAESPRLIRNMGEYDGPWLDWSNETLTEQQEPVRAEYLHVVGEEGEWYKAVYCEEFVGSDSVYVKKEFCKDVKLKTLTFPAPEHMGQFYEIPNGKHKGMVLNWHWGWEDVKMFQIGRKIDKAFLFTHECTFRESYKEVAEDVIFDSPMLLEFNEKYFYLNENQQNSLDLEKVGANAEIMDYILNNLENMSEKNKIYYGAEDDSDWHTYFVDEY